MVCLAVNLVILVCLYDQTGHRMWHQNPQQGFILVGFFQPPAPSHFISHSISSASLILNVSMASGPIFVVVWCGSSEVCLSGTIYDVQLYMWSLRLGFEWLNFLLIASSPPFNMPEWCSAWPGLWWSWSSRFLITALWIEQLFFGSESSSISTYWLPMSRIVHWGMKHTLFTL